jgi:hypothetical protein
MQLQISTHEQASAEAAFSFITHKWGYVKYHVRPEDTSDPLWVTMELTIRIGQLFPLGVELL